MNNNELHTFLYERVKEIQPHLIVLVQNYKDTGMNEEEINTELCFALLHEGYKIRCLEEGIEMKPHGRKLQAHVDEKTSNTQKE